MESDPSGGAKTMNNFVIIAGGIPAGAKMKDKEMNSHPHNEQ